MFQPRASAFDRHVSAIAEHLRAIEKELDGMGKDAGRSALAGASTAGSQITETVWPLLTAISERYLQGQRAAGYEAANFGSQAANIGTKVGNEALDRLASEARQRPLVLLSVAVGVGLLLGFISRRT
jgi:hypothetical protein